MKKNNEILHWDVAGIIAACCLFVVSGGGGIIGGATGTVKLRKFGFDGRRSERWLSEFSPFKFEEEILS